MTLDLFTIFVRALSYVNLLDPLNFVHNRLLLDLVDTSHHVVEILEQLLVEVDRLEELLTFLQL